MSTTEDKESPPVDDAKVRQEKVKIAENKVWFALVNLENVMLDKPTMDE